MTLDELLIIDDSERSREASTEHAVIDADEEDMVAVHTHESHVPLWVSPGDEVTLFEDGRVIASGKLGSMECRGMNIRITIDCPQ